MAQRFLQVSRFCLTHIFVKMSSVASRKTCSRKTAKIGLALNGKLGRWQAILSRCTKWQAMHLASHLHEKRKILVGIFRFSACRGCSPDPQLRDNLSRSSVAPKGLFLRESVLRFWTLLRWVRVWGFDFL